MLLNILIVGLILANSAESAPRPSCVPTSQMREITKAWTDGSRFPGDEKPAGETESTRRPGWGHTVCGDVNGDDIEDLCTLLPQGSISWKAGCFISRKEGRYKFELMTDSRPPMGGTPLPAESYDLILASKGETIEWANGAAGVRLRRDCVYLAQEEAAAQLYCFTGAYFVSAQISD